MLGRICPEKGVHLALEAAHRAAVALRVAGRVFQYPEHVRYFEGQVQPWLDRERTFVGPVAMPCKAQLLAEAMCVVVPSQVAETSSLVAMEALASGTPVIASRQGALPEIIDDGRTGFFADTPEEIAARMRDCARLRPEDCRREAERRFSIERTCQRYLDLYGRLARSPAAQPGIRVDELSSLEQLEALAEEWRALWLRAHDSYVFQSPEWLLPWCRYLLQGELRVLTFRTHELVAIAPFFSWRDGGQRVLSLLGAGVFDYQDLLCSSPDRAACTRALERWLADTRHSWDRLQWSELPEHSALLRVSSRAAETQIALQDVCPALALGEALPASRIQQLAYVRRRAQRECGLAYVACDTSNFESLYAALERLHARRWQLREQPGVLTDARIQTFQRSAARALLQRGQLMLHGVRLCGELAALLYGFHDRGATRNYLSGFEPRFARHSPGLLAIGHAIDVANARGASVFDFLRGAEAYKYAWGAHDHVRLYRRVDSQ